MVVRGRLVIEGHVETGDFVSR